MHVAENISQCLLMPCSGVDVEVCTTMSTCKGTGLGVSSGVMEAGSSWGFTPGTQEGNFALLCHAGNLELLSPLSLLARLRLVAERAVNTCVSL